MVLVSELVIKNCHFKKVFERRIASILRIDCIYKDAERPN